MNKLKHGVLVALLFPLILGFVTVIPIQEVTATELAVPVLIESNNTTSLTGKVGNGHEETPGEWYAGDAPENPIPDAPVLLFVPGLNNIAQIFWEDNDMYETARDAGYQTAFIQLHDAGGESADMWDNGELLAEKIREISEYFGDRKISVIAYSKGGVDTQTALTYYGASNYVENVVTLSSPHHGSELADLAYSAWAGWLADLIGAKGDGTYAMQKGNMIAFRDQIDNEPLAYANPYYTLAGTDWGTIFSANWFGGTYLSQYGSNDGVVTTASSTLPGGQEVAVGQWNHTTIRTGATFPFLVDYLVDSQQVGVSAFPGDSVKEDPNQDVTKWVHGGPLVKDEASETSIFVEEDVKNIQLNLLTSHLLTDLKLRDPDGHLVTPKIENQQHDEGFFAGAYQYQLTVADPQAGEWTLGILSEKDSAYLLVADYTAGGKIKDSHLLYNDGDEHLRYELDIFSSLIQKDSLKVTYHMTQSSDPKNSQIFQLTGDTDLSQTISLSEPDEVYNFTIDIEGLTKSGHLFKRTIIDSVYVDF